MSARLVYLSYDGMTDPLGRSQVLPYLERLAARGHRIRLVSLEKPARFAADRAVVDALCLKAGIEWLPRPYRARPPVAAGWWNARVLERAAARALRAGPADILHARSDLAGAVGLRLRARFGGRLLWDMRSLWSDERAEGGAWDQSKWLYRRLHRHFKALQARLVGEADGIVTLSEAGKAWLLARGARAPIAVIPCCTDFDLFRPDPEARAIRRGELGMENGTRLFLHLGSIGCNVLLDEMIALFARAAARGERAHLLFLAPDGENEIRAAAARHGMADRLTVRGAGRYEVAGWVSAADVGLFFVRPAPSKVAASPTKLAEMLAVGLPVVTGPGIGDVEAIVEDCRAGIVVERFDDTAYNAALSSLDAQQWDGGAIRACARRWFDVDDGAERYDGLIRSMIEERV